MQGDRIGVTLFGVCAYCGAPVSRRYPPARSIPKLMYCDIKCREKCIKEERDKANGKKIIRGKWNLRFPELHDPEWLQANIPGRTFAEVAAELGCRYDTVRKAAKKYGVTR